MVMGCMMKMEKVLRQYDSHDAAAEAACADDDQLTTLQRFTSFMQIMAPYYAASPGFQRVYRIDDFRKRSVCDDWGIRIQPLPQSASDRGH